MRIIAVIGKSGSGKSSLVEELIKVINLKKVISYTTRPMRDNEEDGIHYHFITSDEFEKMKKEGKFASSIAYNVNGGIWKYAISKEDLEVDGTVILVTNPFELKQLQNEYREDVVSIQVDAMLSTRINRSLDRDTIDPHKMVEVTRRMARDEIDFQGAITDYVINNDKDLVSALNMFIHTVYNMPDRFVRDKAMSKGRIYFHTGTMRAGKSAKAIEMINADKIDRECTFVVLKPSKDTRDKGMIRSRNGKMVKCTIIHKDTNLMKLIKRIQSDLDRPINKIYIDEVQFLSTGQILGLYRLKKEYNIEIHCFGLLTSYNNTIFNPTQDIVKISNEVYKIPYPCEICEKDEATHHLLKIDGEYVVNGEPEVVEIKQDMFTCVCLECYSKVIEEELEKRSGD